MQKSLFTGLWAILAVALTVLVCPPPARAGTAGEIDREVDAAMQILFREIPASRELAKVAKGILIFPNVVKAGFVVGAQFGEGALRREGRTAGYFNTVAASYGIQAGAQKFGYALFFMTETGLSYLDRSEGWEIGVGPTIVVVDTGMARSLSTTTAKEDVYAFFFHQKGLMGGLGLQGSKITRMTPEK
jgi:lipid-binding SYLF domain-containing protein